MRENFNHTYELISSLTSAGKFSLRQTEQFISKIGIILRTIGPKQYVFEIPLIVTLFIKELFWDIYNELRKETITYTQILEHLESDLKVKPIFKTKVGELIEAYFLYADFVSRNDISRINKYEKECKGENHQYGRPDEIVSMFKGLRSDGFSKRIDHFKISIRRIQLAENFVTDWKI